MEENLEQPLQKQNPQHQQPQQQQYQQQQYHQPQQQHRQQPHQVYQQQQQYGQPYPQQYQSEAGYYCPDGQVYVTPASGRVIVTTAVQPAPRSNAYPNFQANKAKGISTAMIVVGVFLIVLETIVVVLLSWRYVYSSYMYMGGYSGYWCGSIFIGSGVCASLVARNPGPGLMAATLICALVSLGFAAALFGRTLDTFINLIRHEGFDHIPGVSTCVLFKLIAAVVQFFLSFWLLILCCKSVCCHKTVGAEPVRNTGVQSAAAIQSPAPESSPVRY